MRTIVWIMYNDTLKLIFKVYDFCGVEVFSESVKIAVSASQGIKRIQENILANCESFISDIGVLSVCHVCWLSVCSANATTRRHHVLLGQEPSISVEMVKKSEVEFLFGLRKPLFSGMDGLCFLSEAFWEIVISIFIYSILSLFYFYFYFLSYIFLFLIQAPQILVLL